LKHGQGKWIKFRNDPTSNSYEGSYLFDQKDGFGTFKWHSGNTYQGNFKQDLREGYGQMTWNEGTVYLGNWSLDIQNGYGKLIYPDGSVKEGIFENNVLVKPYINGQPQILKSP
jgi:hypothetical protein